MDDAALKSVVQKFYADVWNKHDKSVIPSLLRSDFTFRGSLGSSKTGHAEFAGYVDFVHQALGAYQCDILDLVAEGHQCFARMRFSGTHRGDFFGFKPTGKKVEWAGAALFSFKDGLVADLWVLGDVHGLLQLLERNSQSLCSPPLRGESSPMLRERFESRTKLVDQTPPVYSPRAG